MLYSDYTLSNQERTEEQKSSFDRQTRTERTEKQNAIQCKQKNKQEQDRSGKHDR